MLMGGCMFFAIIGAEILRTHYSIDAKAVAGSFGIALDDSNSNLGFGYKESNSSKDDFHFWVEYDGKIVDFISPLYGEMVNDVSIKPKIFLRNQNDATNKLDKMGDFVFEKEAQLTDELNQYFYNKPAYNDILNLCNEWFKKPPKFIDTMEVGSNNGNFYVSFSEKTIRDCW